MKQILELKNAEVVKNKVYTEQTIGFDLLHDEIEKKFSNFTKQHYLSLLSYFIEFSSLVDDVISFNTKTTTIIPSKPAIKGTVKKFRGILAKDFPELDDVSADDIDRALIHSRKKSIE